jgi:8-oxo-dGTP pyrophosphatase MutT (NUDIX family)
VSAVVRPAVRALVLDPADRVLLVRGGIDPGESAEDAIRRELREETGLDSAEIGPVIWTRREVFPWAGKTLDQREDVVLVRTAAFEPSPALGREGLAAEDVHELRWWTLEELEASDAVFYPTKLAHFVRRLLESGPPDEPVDVGI